MVGVGRVAKVYGPSCRKHVGRRGAAGDSVAKLAWMGKPEDPEGRRRLSACGGRVTGGARYLDVCVRGRRKFLVGGRPRRVFWWPALRLWPACARVSSFPFTCLRSCLARGSRLGRGLLTRRNFPDVWYKSKKKRKPIHSSHMSGRAFSVLFTFGAFVKLVYSLWWAGGIECAR